MWRISPTLPQSPFAGAVTAALFLGKFVPDSIAWAHLDTFAWRATAKPGRPKAARRSAFERRGGFSSRAMLRETETVILALNSH
jgi:hypothetical protein